MQQIFGQSLRLSATLRCTARYMVLTHTLCTYREKMHQANAYGYKVPEANTEIDWPTLKGKRDKYIERLNGIYERS
jgi:hypothetical protein